MESLIFQNHPLDAVLCSRAAELWLVNGLRYHAAVLMLCHLLPTYVVDTAILSEIKGCVPRTRGLSAHV